MRKIPQSKCLRQIGDQLQNCKICFLIIYTSCAIWERIHCSSLVYLLQLDILQRWFQHGKKIWTWNFSTWKSSVQMWKTMPCIYIFKASHFMRSVCEKGLGLWAGGLVEQSAAPTHYSEVCPQWAVVLRKSRQTLSYCCCHCLEKKQRKHHSHNSPQWETGTERDGKLLEPLVCRAFCRSNSTLLSRGVTILQIHGIYHIYCIVITLVWICSKEADWMLWGEGLT